MIAQLRAKRPLNQRLLQLLEKPVRACEVLGLLIVRVRTHKGASDVCLSPNSGAKLDMA
jgi:hypothetical protein